MQPSELGAWLTAAGGVAHRDDILTAGFTDYAILLLMQSRSARRIRRSWIASIDAPVDLVRAATLGGRLTCASATARNGLWAPTKSAGHIGVAHNSRAVAPVGMTLHWARGPAPVRRRALVDPVENVLFHVARCLPRADALAVWESALRTGHDLAYLSGIRWRSAAAAELLAALSTLSGSGIESHFVAGVRRMGLTVRQQVSLDGHDVDAVIGERLVVQVDGFRHHQANQRRADIRDDARLVLRGYTVLRFDWKQILFDWPYVEATIRGAVAQGRHLA